MWRNLGIFLIACTGIGAIYLLFRTTFISPGNVGLVRNYYTGKNEILGPGYHCILSPFRWLQSELPGRNKEALVSKKLDLHTADNIEIEVNIDTRFVVENGVAATENVKGDFQDALTKTTETALAAIITEKGYTFQALSSSHPVHTGPVEANAAKTPMKGDKNDVSLLSRLVIELLKRVNDVCAPWGLKVNNVQIVNMKAKDSKIQNAIEQSATLQVAARNELVAAQTKTETKKMEALMAKITAEGEANAEIEKARGYKTALQIRTDADEARTRTLADKLHLTTADILARDMQIQTAESLAKTQGTLLFNGGSSGPTSNFNTLGLFGLGAGNKGMRQQTVVQDSKTTPALPALSESEKIKEVLPAQDRDKPVPNQQAPENEAASTSKAPNPMRRTSTGVA